MLNQMAETDLCGEHQRHEKSRLEPDARNHDKTVLLLAEKVRAKALDEIKPDRDTEEQGALSRAAPCSFGIKTVGLDLA